MWPPAQGREKNRIRFKHANFLRIFWKHKKHCYFKVLLFFITNKDIKSRGCVISWTAYVPPPSVSQVSVPSACGMQGLLASESRGAGVSGGGGREGPRGGEDGKTRGARLCIRTHVRGARWCLTPKKKGINK